MSVRVDDVSDRDGVVVPAALSLPSWPARPEPVDVTGRSFLVVELGDESSEVAGRWITDAAALGDVAHHRAPRLVPDELHAAVSATRCGVRIMVTGPQDDVLLALAVARAAGAEPAELRSFVTRSDVLPVFCAHCRVTSRVAAEPGSTTRCPSCGRSLDVHPHLSAVRGSFLGSDATARELV